MCRFSCPRSCFDTAKRSKRTPRKCASGGVPCSRSVSLSLLFCYCLFFVASLRLLFSRNTNKQAYRPKTAFFESWLLLRRVSFVLINLFLIGNLAVMTAVNACLCLFRSAVFCVEFCLACSVGFVCLCVVFVLIVFCHCCSLLIQMTLHPFAGGVPLPENFIEQVALTTLLLVRLVLFRLCSFVLWFDVLCSQSCACVVVLHSHCGSRPN